MTYTEQDVRKFINEAYRAGVEEGIRRAREGAARERTIRQDGSNRAATRQAV